MFTKQQLKKRLIGISHGDFVTPLLEEIWELIKDIPLNKEKEVNPKCKGCKHNLRNYCEFWDDKIGDNINCSAYIKK